MNEGDNDLVSNRPHKLLTHIEIEDVSNNDFEKEIIVKLFFSSLT